MLELGHVVIVPGTREACEAAGANLDHFIKDHRYEDGELEFGTEPDWEPMIDTREEMMSLYPLRTGDAVLIVTSADRKRTIVMLQSQS